MGKISRNAFSLWLLLAFCLMGLEGNGQTLNEKIDYYLNANERNDPDGIVLYADDLLKDVIKNLHTVTPHGGGSSKISQMAENLLLEFSKNGGLIHVSEGSFQTYGINKDNYDANGIDVSSIFWSYPKELIQESSKADIVISY